MKYQGHPHARGYAKNCPDCGHWLEDAENVERPFPVETGKSILVALLVGVVAYLSLGDVPGVVAGGVALLVSRLLGPEDPHYYCFACKKFWTKSEVKQSEREG